MNHKPKNAIIFTDGSSRGNPGPGGWGAIIVFSRQFLAVGEETEDSDKICIKEIGGGEPHTTNNRMELRAMIGAFEFVKKLKTANRQLTVYSDSSYLINGITKWIHGWQTNGWLTKAKQSVENKDLWEKLAEIKRLIEIDGCLGIDWKLVGGHAGIAGNERCDEIATAFADGLKPKLYEGQLEQYAIKSILEVSDWRSQTSFKKSRCRAKAYSYVSLVDGAIKTHKTWEECESRVKGKPAKFKKALSAEEEKSIIESWG